MPGVCCGLIGMKSVEEVRRAAKAAREFRPLTPAEMAETIAKGEALWKAQGSKAMMMHRHLDRDFGGATALA